MIHDVELSRRAEKQLVNVPRHVARKLLARVEAVEEDGLEVVRRIPGFHDQPLRGKRAEQRSIRLDRRWRAIYRMVKGDEVNIARIDEVIRHEY